MAKFAKVRIEMTATDCGGRMSPVHLVGYRPHFVAVDGDGTYLGVEFIEGPDDSVRPGDSAFALVRFVYVPQISYAALVPDAEFEIREGGKTVGMGKVVAILDAVK